MSFLYWIFGVEGALRRSLPSLSVHDEGFSRGWIFVLALLLLPGLLWLFRKSFPNLKFGECLALVMLRWGFFLLLLFLLVRPVLVLTGEEVPGLPESEKIDIATAPWILVVMLLLLCSEWLLKRKWRLK